MCRKSAESDHAQKAQKGPGYPKLDGWGLSVCIALMAYMCPVVLYNDAGAVLRVWLGRSMGKTKDRLKRV